MLARLLRITLFSQMAVGALLGCWLSGKGTLGTALALQTFLAALAMPLGFTLATVLYTAVVSRSKEGTALWWRALIGECVASIRMFQLRQPWSFAAPAIAEPTSGTHRVPVVLIHGFICNVRLWDGVIPALQAQGHTVLAINLEPVFTSIDDYAVAVEKAVQALRSHSGQDSVALVGHSMGGVVIRAWMRRYGTAHVARAITLGTPHAGTQVGRWPIFPNGTQMMWQSRWLTELAASESDATRKLFRIGLTLQDNIVFPQRAQTLPGVEPVVFNGLGHMQLCTSAAVTRWLCAELEPL